MLKRFSMALIAGGLCLSGMAESAQATVTFSLIWQATTGAGATGSSAIDAAPGDILTLGLQMTTDQTIAAHGVSLNFDTDLGNELNLLNPNGGKNWAGTTYGTTTMAATYSPLGPVNAADPAVESTSAVAGRINSFNSGINPVAGALISLPTGTYTIGTARFVSNGGVTDGADVFIGLFNIGVDEVLNNAYDPIGTISVLYGSASVNAIPEPGTAALVGLGLVGILLVCRRSGRW